MRTSKSEAGMAMLGGALLGAAVMYLMDPETGRRRRRYLADRASETLHGAGELAESAWEKTRDLGSSLSDRAASGSNGAAEAFDSARETAADKARRLRD